MKKLEEMSFKDDFMFTAAMLDEEICRDVLEVILGIPIESVTVDTEKSLKGNPVFKGVRLDALAEENGNKRRFDVEMQVEKYPDLPKRSRYYHSQMDIGLLYKGNPYQELPDTYVIFICDYDPVGDKKYRYTYRATCSETGKIMQNGQTTIFLNSKGEDKEKIPDDLYVFLQYIKNPEEKEEQDILIQKIKERVKSIKQDREWRSKYMKFEELINMEKEKAIKEEREKRLNAEARAEEEKARAEEEKARAEEEKARAEEEKIQRENAEMEIKRLRLLLENR